VKQQDTKMDSTVKRFYLLTRAVDEKQHKAGQNYPLIGIDPYLQVIA
jgi:hypothetical protein